MLGKLLKHEFKYNAKIFLPIYMIMLILAAVIRVVAMVNGSGNTISDFSSTSLAVEITYVLIIIAFVFGLFGIVLYAMFGNITRFHKNLFTDEGYLMNTLPLPAYYHILCKLISGLVCYAVTVIFVILACMLAFDATDVIEFVPDLFGSDYLILSYLLSIVGYCAFLLLCYMSEAISSKLGGKKGISAIIVVGCLIGNSILTTIISTIVLAGFNTDVYSTTTNDQLISVSVVNLIYYIGISVGLFFITNNLLKNHLNLE